MNFLPNAIKLSCGYIECNARDQYKRYLADNHLMKLKRQTKISNFPHLWLLSFHNPVIYENPGQTTNSTKNQTPCHRNPGKQFRGKKYRTGRGQQQRDGICTIT